MSNLTFEFLEAAAKWGWMRGVEVQFSCDQYRGWRACLNFKDANGSYSVFVTPVFRHEKRGETPAAFEKRVKGVLGRAAAKARANRQSVKSHGKARQSGSKNVDERSSQTAPDNGVSSQ